MNYSVEFFENEMAVLGKKGKDAVATINFVTGRAHFRLAKVYILCGDRSLNKFLLDLRENFRALKEKAKRFKLGNQHHGGTWKNAGLEFKFSPGADVRSVIKQFGKLLRDVGPLLELGEIIFKQLERRPLNATTSMKLYMPMPMIDGMPVKQWLQSRERAALDIDPATAKIAYTAEQLFDPYGVYPEVPERYRYSVRDHFACSPDSNVWVWFGDLPQTTADALNKRMDAEDREAKSRKKDDREDFYELW